MRWFNKLRTLFRKPKMEQELDDELRFHLEKQIEQNIAQGMSAEEARYAALRQFGNVGAIKEECREAWGTRFINELAQDIRYGLRQLRRNPGFTIVAILTLALGIGANTAIFSVVDSLILRPLPVDHPGELVRIYSKTPQVSSSGISYPDYSDLKEQASAFSGFLVWDRGVEFLNSMNESSQILVDRVSRDYFTTLGVSAFRGRTFLSQTDSGTRGEPTVVISYRLWKNRLGAASDIVGKTIKLTGVDMLVVGIAPPGFLGLDRVTPTDAWLLASESFQHMIYQRGARYFEAMGRLKKGATIPQARAQLEAIGHRLAAAYPATNKATTFMLVPENRTMLQDMLASLLFLLLPGLVLLIACANVAGLLLSRGEARRRELAMRMALGAGRMRVARQLMTEGFLLSIIGAGLGLLLTRWLIEVEASIMPLAPFQIGPILKMDGTLFVFTLLVAVAATVVFSLAPALQALKTEPFPTLKGEAVPSQKMGGRIHLRSLLVTGQIAVSVLLLSTAMLLLRSFDYTLHIPLGFDIHKNLLVINVFQSDRFKNQAMTFLPDLAEKLQGLPGVRRAACARRMLLSSSGGGASVRVSIPGTVLPQGQSSMPVGFNSVGPGYFETVGTRILSGRDFRSSDGPHSPKVAIVSEMMAKRFWRGGDAIGHSLTIAGEHYQIVGIAENARTNHVHEAYELYLYLPFAQKPSSEGALILETNGNPRGLAGAAKAEIRKTDPAITVWEVQTSKQLLHYATWQDAMLMKFSGALGLLGIFLAMIGLYGVISYVVTWRTHEIGIRMALGARPRDVLAKIMWRGLLLVAVGTAIGIAAATATTRLLASSLYGVTPYDPWSLICAILAVSVVSVLACYIPARRAAKVDPMVALRYE
ncbi:MAG TPA: ABC transporter permease [Terriglobia bacterium]|nr:ABC transporter permease [Terriglobia bacterium]